ncbi:hypothetical protein KEM52_001248 [Ascosphaera acerosa]|nr:hypothetical protein KEM52_001248 [Ascosphaera acerosa]
MRFSVGYLLLALSAAAIAAPEPEVVNSPEPGTPAYECHADCGGVITISKEEKYCSRDDFKKKVKSCLNCANKYDIWQFYGSKVASAAESCDLDSEPKKYSKDEIVKATVAASATATVTATATATSVETATVTAEADSGASGKSGLAKGAIAGIVISCVVGAIAIIVGTIFACKRRRMKQAYGGSGAGTHEMAARGGVKWTPETTVSEQRV